MWADHAAALGALGFVGHTLVLTRPYLVRDCNDLVVI